MQRREEEQQAEQERIKAEKELEVARLRAQQERAQDKQAEKVRDMYEHSHIWLTPVRHGIDLNQK